MAEDEEAVGEEEEEGDMERWVPLLLLVELASWL
jgi:hypothetical protein